MGTFLKNREIQSGSTGIRIPTGSAANRPDQPVFGQIRFNTDSSLVEFYNGTAWVSLSAGGSVSYTVDGGFNITFTSDPPDGIPINVIHTNS